jgi:hypothetical protein
MLNLACHLIIDINGTDAAIRKLSKELVEDPKLPPDAKASLLLLVSIDPGCVMHQHGRQRLFPLARFLAMCL